MCAQYNPLKTSPTRKRWVRRGKGCLLIVILVPIIYYGLYFILRGRLPSNPQLIAHRGGPAQAPENTMAAFRKAIAVGADWIELDVQRTRDGALVVIHDETIDRTTDGVGSVADLTLEEIRALDAGGGEQVPIFEKVIQLARSADVGLLPEAKSAHLYPGMEDEMLQAIIGAEYVDRTMIQCFEGEVLEKVREIYLDAQVCPLYGLWELDLSDPRPRGAEAVCPMAEMVVLNPWMIRQAHADGKKVFVWFGVIEHPMVMHIILALGADGLMVDDPVALAEILGR